MIVRESAEVPGARMRCSGRMLSFRGSEGPADLTHTGQTGLTGSRVAFFPLTGEAGAGRSSVTGGTSAPVGAVGSSMAGL